MKIAVFTSNQPRHVSLLRLLSEHGHQVSAVLETTAVQQVAPNSSPMRRKYFGEMYRAENKFFGDSLHTPNGARVVAIPMGQINFLEREHIAEFLDCDQIIVFGSDYIKGWLVDELVERKAINIHMGLSPYFRGSACNFWALFDGFPCHVGGTIHLLSRGLDSGGMLYHALPTFSGEDPFEFAMKAVLATQNCLVRVLGTRLPDPVQQLREHEIRYSRSADFTDDVIVEYLARDLSATRLARSLDEQTKPSLVNPQYL